ncbi:hypothetical protein [Aquimarina longa]|uniref:hypothetical protein n=1 Tax=Aquimarina longa TaxID=1080221 RepID=UPI000782CDB0|nr:hypothetical protein [Aquimarina longa]
MFVFVLFSCSSNKKVYKKTPIDEFVTTYIDEQNYSVILADMDYKEEEDSYYHKYRILIEKPKTTVDSTTLSAPNYKAEDVVVKDTEWRKVSDVFFDDHVNNLGMTILSKKNGVLDKKTSPAGYDNYVGNERYGRWENNTSGGGSFWAFYGQYHFLSSMFYGSSHRYYRGSYMDYDRNYRGSRGYYGSGRNQYGTNSSVTKGTANRWSGRSSAFKNKVRNSVKKSATITRSRSYNSNSKYSKTTRNSSRYSNSSSRSRAGGYGK